MRIGIVGAGEVGFNAAQVLPAEARDVVVVEQNKALAEKATEGLDALVMQGNGTSPRVLLVAATNSDEANIIAALAAKAQGALRTVARIHNEDYYDSREPFTQEVLGIGFAIDTERMATEEIRGALTLPGAVERGDVRRRTHNNRRGDPSRGRAGRRETGSGRGVLPERSLVVGVVRDGEALVPRGDTVLEARDRVHGRRA